MWSSIFVSDAQDVQLTNGELRNDNLCLYSHFAPEVTRNSGEIGAPYEHLIQGGCSVPGATSIKGAAKLTGSRRNLRATRVSA